MELSHRPGRVLVDAAGGDSGGAARWRAELDRHLSAEQAAVTVIGRGQRLTTGWLARRERLARGAALVVAPNNVSFAVAGGQRRVLLRNALHFLHPSEEELLARMPRSFRVQVPLVRRLARRADLIVVPCSAMADRVVRHLPVAAPRIAVRPHPVTPLGPRLPAQTPSILVPVVPGPYKNLLPQLRLLVAAADRIGHPARIMVTAAPADLPADLAGHPRISAIGLMPPSRLAQWWRTSWAAFYPGAVESFGYPLAEARVYGVPVIAPDTAQAREIAGGALRGYDLADPADLDRALAEAGVPPVPAPDAFDCDDYFRFLFGDEAAPAAPTASRPVVAATTTPPERR